ncbi:MAG: SDR family oxidoreductase [Bdellovibrionales bacterium]|nr:SDR family oxidoreductase [Bdellovibrionales bacterium]
MRIVITGASRGIGAEFVRVLLAEGHEVHAVTRNADRLAEFTKEKNLHVHAIDLENVAGPETLSRALEGRPIDLLINNAGMYATDASLAKLKFDDVRTSFEVNTILPMRVCQALLPNLNKGAKVAQITSLMGSIADNGSGGSYAYRMSKTALNMFNKCFAIERPDLTTVVLHPGWVQTDMGGKQAPTTPKQSVAGMLKVIGGLKTSDTGKFYDFEGDELPW